MTTCAICSQIPDSVTANTGRDEYLPDSTHALKRGSGDFEGFRVCPTCDRLYVWTEYTSQSGSGNNDDETLTRLSADRTATIRACFSRGDTPPDDHALRIGDALFALPPVERDIVFDRLCVRDRDLVRAFFQRMIRAFVKTRDRWLHQTLYGLANEPRDARRILELIEGTPHSEADFQYLKKHCRERAAASPV